MTQPTHSIVDLTPEEIEAFFKSALRNTMILGLISAIVVWIGGGWRNAAMMLTGTLI